MTIKYHTDLYQGDEAWHTIRRGLLTASEMKHILTPAKLAYASNEKERSHVYEIAAQRISNYTEPCYIGDDMLRGQEDEIYARIAYHENYAPVQEVGFVTNDSFGFTLGYSPDGLVGDDGLIEIKSRRQKFQIETIIDGGIPAEYTLQVQTGLLITGRNWCDFISYSGGLPMAVVRVMPDKAVQDAILTAAETFESRVREKVANYKARISAPGGRFVPTERRIVQEVYV